MATISNTPRPGYVWDSTDNVWYPIGVGGHGHPDYITQATAVNPTIIDAKGDIITATAADTPARLAVGTTNQVLTVDSSTATGLKWATPSSGSSNVAGKNGALNSNFSVWQRGTSVAFGSYTYTADRWQAYNVANVGTASRQVTGDTTNLPNIQYCARIQRTSGSGATNAIQFSQSFETINSIQYAGKTVTLSFYARKGANYSPTSDILYAAVYTGTGTDERILAGYTGSANPINQSATLTSTWQRFSYSGTVAATANEIGIAFTANPIGTAGANDYFEITGVQLEIASSASDYSPNQATYASELAACQRYYFRSASDASNTFIAFAQGVSATATTSTTYLILPVQMRVNPTSVGFANLCISDLVNYNLAVSALAGGQVNTRMMSLDATHTTGATINRPAFLRSNNSSAAYLEVSAEL